MANEAVRHLKDAEFRAFLEEKSVALVDFWASWVRTLPHGGSHD